MAPLKFERLLSGPVLDMFTKEYAHENFWEIEHNNNINAAKFINNYKFGRQGDVSAFTNIKGLLGKHSELKFQANGAHFVEVGYNVTGYKPLNLFVKGMLDDTKKRHLLDIHGEHITDLNTTGLKLGLVDRSFSLFTLFNLGPQRQCTFGGEVDGGLLGQTGKLTLAAAYNKNADAQKYHVGIAMTGKFSVKDPAIKVLARAMATSNVKNYPKILAAEIEQGFKEAKPKFRVAGQLYLTPADHQTAAFVKAKCDSDAQVALAYSQKFSDSFTATLGCKFQGKDLLDNKNVQYGVKFNVC
ncbi:Porin domain superfamily [Babesia duncani]|uniref:Porin domain superfamily n=1 Tax=Babesia duncani TaxID=323732 RepID=A0AAD9PKH7_9APIC|nr:Porin domain superfamily [Babesia duncani]